jgi:phi13 family phage major tail protein
MAQIGLKFLRYSPIGEDGNYTGIKTIAKAVESKVAPNTAEAKLYGDDEIAENVALVSGGTIDITTTDDPDEVFAELLGHSYNEQTKEVVKNDDDNAPYVGFGRIITKLVNNVLKYKAEFYTKVKFKDSIPDAKTKGESIEFATPTLSGNFFPKAETVEGVTKNKWSSTKTCDTFDEAVEYLTALMSPAVE